MIIDKILIDNFQIFYGQQTLELSRGLFIVHGENGRGKSTFLNAVTWALFGEYLNRQGAPVTPSVMLNTDAKAEGKTAFSVELYLTQGTTRIRVKRSYDTTAPEVGVRLTVEQDGNMLNQDDGEELLRGLLDRDVSRFFLFDGEELRRYEELLSGEATAADAVRESIEHILGLPALTNAARDLQSVAEKFSAEATKAARKEEGAERAAKRADQFEVDIKGAQEDLDLLQAKKGELEEDVKAATSILQVHEASQDKIKKKVQIETEIRGLEDHATESKLNRAEAMKGVWRDILANAVKPKVAELRSSLDDERQREAWKVEADAIEAALEADICDRCNQKLHGDAEASMRATLQDLRAKPQPSGAAGSAGARLGVLASISADGRTARVIDADRTVRRNDARLVQARQRLEDATAAIEGVPELELQEAAKKRDGAMRLLGVTEDKITDKQKAIGELKTKLAAARKEAQAQSSSQAVADLSARQEYAEALASVFEQAKDEFRDAMRDQVGSDASDLFVKLTAEKELTGLQIKENYGLDTLGPNGDPVPGRSAGQEQIVAFALIGALNRNATRRAPIIMDTPLGRLGKDHKANVLASLADFGEQVILLVHDDEVSDQQLNTVRSSVVAEHELFRNELFQTQIRKR